MRMADMAALAALRDGDRTHAVARWTDVVQTRPLSWPALTARARLAEIGATIPSAADASEPNPDPPPPPLAVVVPPPADFLLRVGLDSDAEAARRERETAIAGAVGPRGSEALCSGRRTRASDVRAAATKSRRRFSASALRPAASVAGPRTALGMGVRWFLDACTRTKGDARHRRGWRKAAARALVGGDASGERLLRPGRKAVSPARAVGLMQLILPETARTPGADESRAAQRRRSLDESPLAAIRVGARLLRKLIDRFHGDVVLALAAYNGGADPVEHWLSRSGGMQVDLFVERIPYRETRDYVSRVMSNLARYAYLAQGEEGVPRVPLDLKPR